MRDSDLFTNEELKEVIITSGLEYAILHYCSGVAIHDPKLARLWDKAANSCQMIKEYLGLGDF